MMPLCTVRFCVLVTGIFFLYQFYEGKIIRKILSISGKYKEDREDNTKAYLI